MLQDLRFALRGFFRNPTFTAVAVLTLALGLGANTAIFSVVDAVLLKPLPYPDPDRLVLVSEKNSRGNRSGVAALTFLDWRESSKTIALASLTGTWMTMTGRGEPQRVQARIVSWDYFEMLGAQPASGRTFSPDEGVPGNERVLLISHRFWANQLGLDPNVLGKTLTLDGSPYSIIGTLPAGSSFDRNQADIWMPAAYTRGNTNRAFRFLQGYGRLRPGATLASAQAEMDAIAARLARDYPETNSNSGVIIDRLSDRVVNQQLRQSLFVLFAAVGAVLLVACVNLANLLLARSAGREREIWIRLSLGAGRDQLLRQFLMESVLLAVLGGIAGCVLGAMLLKGLIAMIPPFTLPTQADLRIDWSVMAYLFAVAVVSGILSGLAPAIAAWRRDVSEGLREKESTGGISGRRLRSALIVAEVALTFVLAATAGVLIRSFDRLMNVSSGVEMTNVVTLNLPRAMGKDTDGPRLAALMDEMRDAVARVQGVMNAAIASSMPMRGISFGLPFSIQGPSRANADARAGCGLKIVSSEYFETLGIKIKAGRGLAKTDIANAQRVAVINDAMAKEFFKNASPVGQHITMPRIVTGKTELAPPVSWEIVGVVSDERTGALNADSPSVAYVTFDQSPIVGVGLVVRSHSDPVPLKRSIESAIWSVNRDQAITDFQTLEEIKSQSAANPRFNTLLLAGFAGTALLLAAVGIYGVVAYSVAQRTRELGIRAALGASGTQLMGSALGSSVMLTASGLVIGAIGVHWTGRLVASLLFNTEPSEPVTLIAVAAMLIGVSTAASWIPARRAARVDPVVALRQE
jgi:putative ABC transport system permease protein